jgi:hypothetical protein
LGREASGVETQSISELSALPAPGFDLSIEAAVCQGLVLIQRHAEVSKRGIIECGHVLTAS